MPTPVNQVPTNFTLAQVQVSNPISSAHLLRLAEECSFNGGHNLHVVASVNVHNRAPARVQLFNMTQYSLPFVYYRHPGARVLCAVVKLAPGYSTAGTIELNVTLPSGATWLQANGLDSTVQHRYPPTGRVGEREIVGFIDVSGVTAATATFGSLTAKANVVQGISRLITSFQLFEVPLASSNVSGDPTEPMLEQAWTLHPNRLIDGGSSSPRGLTRLAHLMDAYRSQVKKHAQLIGIESTDNTGTTTNPHWHRETNTYGQLEWQYNQGTHDAKHRLIVRNLYGVGAGAAAHPYTLHFRYKTTGGTGGNLRIYPGGVGGAAAVATTKALAATTNVWTWDSVAVNIPADGTGGLVEYRFEVQGGGAGHLMQFSNFTLVDMLP